MENREDEDSCHNTWKNSLSSLSVPVYNLTVPLTVATRGIGFACALEYSKMIQMYRRNRRNCNIHEFYRVYLCLTLYEIKNYDHTRYTLQCSRSMVGPVPIICYLICEAISNIEAGSTHHSFLKEIDEDSTYEECALYLSPLNIRNILNRLSTRDTPRTFRDGFRALNPIPGARWSETKDDGFVLENRDDIWPEEYNHDLLYNDIFKFKTLMSMNTRRPCPRIPSEPVGSNVGLVSFPLRRIGLYSHYKLLDVDHDHYDSDDSDDSNFCDYCAMLTYPGEYKYSHDNLEGGSGDSCAWSHGEISSSDFMIGAATMIGEHLDNDLSSAARLEQVCSSNANVPSHLYAMQMIYAKINYR